MVEPLIECNQLIFLAIPPPISSPFIIRKTPSKGRNTCVEHFCNFYWYTPSKIKCRSTYNSRYAPTLLIRRLVSGPGSGLPHSSETENVAN